MQLHFKREFSTVITSKSLTANGAFRKKGNDMVQSINFRKRRRFGSANGQFDFICNDNHDSTGGGNLGTTESIQARDRAGTGADSIGGIHGFGRMPTAPEVSIAA